LVEWGKDVDASKALLDELGLTEKVIWLPTMKKRELWAAYCKANVVVDQFVLPALGGVGFETMALGCRLITAINDNELEHFFGTSPPCLSANNIGDCAERLRQVFADPGDVHDVFQCKQFGRLGAPLGAGLARFIAVLGFAERDAQPTFFRFWPCTSSAVKPANAFTLLCWSPTLQLCTF
jgi:hypothetical protein